MPNFIEVMLSLILIALIVLIVVQVRSKQQPPPEAELIEAFRAATAELRIEARQYVQVNAVNALIEEFQVRPELMNNLAGYARHVAAAALKLHLDSLYAQLDNAENRLKEARAIVANLVSQDSGWKDIAEERAAFVDKLLSNIGMAERATRQHT